MTPPSRLLAAALAALVATACGSSSTTSATAPGAVTRCAVSIGGGNATIPAEGGTGQLAITTARECAWTASTTASWLTIRAGANGQGDGSLEYAATANPDPSTRRAAIEVNAQRADISQEPGSCTFTLGSSASSFQTAGGAGSIEVRASSPMCTWTAVSDASWVAIRSGSSGTGNAAVQFDVEPGSSAPRTATILVAGLRHAVTQGAGACSFSVSPTTFAAAASGGSRQFAVSAPSACPWTAASNVPWAAVTAGSSGSGNGTVSVAVEPTPGPARSGSVFIAGQSIEISQAAGCSYDVAPLAHTIGAAGGTVISSVTAASGCAWTASTATPWIVLSGATSGSGSGAVSLGIAPATGGQRTGTVTVAGRQITVTQGAGCAFGLSPTSATVDAAGGSTSVAVSAAAGCAWTASSSVSWISVASGASGSGDGTVTLSIAASTGAARAANITIAGQVFTVNQAGGCSVSLSPASATAPAAGGSGSIAVTAGSGCAWSAATADGWITVSGAGSGTGTVDYTVAPSTGATRTGRITVGSASFTITQGSGCTFSLNPTSTSVPSGGSAGSVAVSAPDGCAWTASSNDGWIAVTGGATGSGNGTVAYRVDATIGGGRSGSLTIAGQTFTVNQGSGCTIGINPSTAGVPAAGGTGTVGVSAGAGCGWSATSNAAWISITAGASGSGDGTVSYSVAANTGSGRSGTLTIGGRTFTVNQEGGCTIGINPSTAGVPAAGGTGTVGVSAGAGCGWSATSNAAWISIAAGASGSGDGTVSYSVAANTGSGRSGTLTIGGRTFTVNQAGGCTFTVAPPGVDLPATGGSATITVTTVDGCGWTATSSADWVTIASGSAGSGSGPVVLTAAPNAGGARTGSVTIAGQTVTVTQPAVVLACTFSVSPPSRKADRAGGPGMFNLGTSASTCSWSPVSTVPWVTVLDGGSRVGAGKVDYVVAPNGDGVERTGTIVVHDAIFTIVQSS